MDIFDYIKNNDSVLEELNTLDAIVLTRLSYLHLEDIEIMYPIKISALENYIKNIKTNHNDAKLVTLLSKSKRFKDIEIKRFKHIEDNIIEEVFTGITFSLPCNTIFIAFRGTGKKPTDFKEDMNMSYRIVPSCFEGIKYIEEEKNYSKMYISGHSKGGHIAMYSASHTTFFNRIKIIKVFNFDGPGFLDITKELKGIQDKIINYFPESSIVGRLMNSIGQIEVIKTEKQGIEAHSIYNWKINNNGLVKGELTNNSNLFHEECLSLLETISKEKREDIINQLFSLMLKGELKNIKELDLVKIKDLIGSIPHLEKEEKDALISFFKMLLKVSMPEVNPKKLITGE